MGATLCRAVHTVCIIPQHCIKGWCSQTRIPVAACSRIMLLHLGFDPACLPACLPGLAILSDMLAPALAEAWSPRATTAFPWFPSTTGNASMLQEARPLQEAHAWLVGRVPPT